MDYVKSYVNEIGKRLPTKTRSDIEKELSSILMDMIEDRAESTGAKVDDSLIKNVLRDYGTPDQVASRYLPERYLIPPKMFPLFWMVLRIAVVVILILLTVGFGIKMGQEIDAGKNLAVLFLEYLAGMGQALVQVLGTIVIVFYLIQRFSPSQDFVDKSWDPNSLEEVKESSKVDRGDLIVSIVFILIGLIVFAFFPDKIPFGYISGEGWIRLDVFTDVFYRFIPVFIVLWAVELFLNLYVLFRNEWVFGTRVIDIILDVVGIVVLIVLITGPSIVQLPVDLLQSTGGVFAPDAYDKVQRAFVAGIDIALGIAAAVSAIKAGQNIYKLITNIK